MKKTFGTPTGNHHLTGAHGGTHAENFPTLPGNMQGIYVLIPNDTSTATGFGATGHADLFYSCTCDGHCYFDATGGVKDICFWPLN